MSTELSGVAATASVGLTPSLPAYPDLIMATIDALKDPNGSNKSAISRQIEETYGELPPAHSTLLAHHLNRMKAAGQLTLSKNNYSKPDPNAPARRGRGRPPKPKPALPADYVPAPPRPRGRPPKERDPLAPPLLPKRKEAPAEGSGRKRGRPPKVQKATPAAAPPAAAGVSGGAPRGRGRPPKVKQAVPAAAPAATVGA